VAIAAVLVSLGACSSGDSSQPVNVGQGDRGDNGQISIDETKLAATVESETLKVTIPISAIGTTAASGTLNVRVIDVQGTNVVSSIPLTYSLPAGGASNFVAQLPAPAGLVKQENLVGFNLRIDDTAGLRITRSLLYVVTPYDVRLEGPATVTRGKGASYRVRAESVMTKTPIAGVPVQLVVMQGEQPVQTLDGTSSAEGDAVFPVMVDAPGTYVVSGAVTGGKFSPKVQDPVKVEDSGQRILLTSDKPIYQPGQTVNLRALALQRDGNKPLANSSALFEIEDAKGNKIYKKSITTDPYGIAATKFTIGQLVNMGDFKLRVTIGTNKTEKTVNVSQYALPKFDVSVQSEKPWYRPGDVVNGTVDAKYFFGKLVSAGDVAIEASSLDVGQTVFQKVMGKLDAQGHYQFSIHLPSVLTGVPLQQGSAAIALKATVTDSAGQAVVKQATLTVSNQGMSVALVPEATQIVPGVDNQLLLFVSDPLGTPIANANITVTPPSGTLLQGVTDAFGQSTLTWTAPTSGGQLNFAVNVNAQNLPAVSQTFSFGSQSGKEHLVVRTDKAVYGLGETVKVDVVSSDDKHNVYVDWLNAGQTVDMRTLKGSQGTASFSMAIDNGLIGSNRVEAYVVDDDGNIVRAGRSIFVRNSSSLSVSLATDKPTYGPGQPAKLTFSVKDEQGKPAVAALGVQIVDQAVFSLVDAQPGLLRSFFELEDIYSKPTYEIAPPSVDMTQLLFANDPDPNKARASQTLTQAALAALGNHSMMGIEHRSWPDVVTAANTQLVPDYQAAHDNLLPALKTIGITVASDLAAAGCKASDYYCQARGDSYWNLLQNGISDAIRAYDYWGNSYRTTKGALTLTTNGPDELSGTPDDHAITFTLDEIGQSPQSATRVAGGADAGVNFGAAMAAAGPGGPALITAPVNGTGAGGGGGGASVPDNSNATDDTPRVRQDFPETLYVNPSIITGADGTASIDVDMADSITQWRVSSLANSPDGKLGGGQSGVTVFQDFFVDINFPPTLTRGDQVSFPIAVYNYLNDPQTVQLDLQAEGWFTALGATSTTVTLQPGQVSGVSFPVRVDQVGLRTLTVKAKGTSRSDAVARTVHVVPDGKQIGTTASGLLAPGNATSSFTFPVNAVPGSGELYVDVYPAFLAQVVGGMDSILRQPTGCFEQTTSSTWPNVLVTAYMQKTKQITPAIQIKAESLISAGYQRLLTFEHPGGGFSWFGTQDPAPYLSVTAFGLMEFADMMQVADVDQAMFERTRAWMLKQQKADGSWEGDKSEFFSFQTSALRNTAFVVWALAAGGYQGPELAKGIEFVKAGLAKGGSDGYTLGIAANALQLVAPDDPATAKVMTDLDALKKVDGEKISWDSGGTQTNFYGGGNDAAVTTTALVLQALLTQGSASDLVNGALKFLTASKDPNGNFGSTQATVWSLRALLLAASKGSEGAVGSLIVSIDGQQFQTLSLAKDQSDVLTTVDLSSFATSGSHQVSLDFSGTGKVSYNAVAKHNIPWSAVVEPQGPLSIGVSYDKQLLYVNDTVKATVQVHNNTTSTENMILVTVGLPPGFEVMTDDLSTYLANRSLSKYEITGKQLMLYVSTLAPSGSLAMSYRLRATLPVKASDGGAEAHLYYEPQKSATAAASLVEAQSN
jgi:uncharacterized protein YfaS (alpha-2-macroglobulin family)